MPGMGRLTFSRVYRTTPAPYLSAGPTTVTLNPAVLALTAVAVSPQAIGAAALSPAVLTLTAVATTPTPGQVAVSLNPAVVTLAAQAVSLVIPTAFPASVDGTGRWLVTSAGDPWPMWIDSQWDLLSWGGGRSELGGGTTPAAVYDGYAAIQAANGFNAVIIMAVNSNQDGEVGPYQDGRLWDGVAPWGAGGIGDLNEPYWARLDSLIDACASHGITVYLELITSYTLASGTAFASLNTTNAATFGTAIGNRYKSRPNIIYCFGVDYFATFESSFAACLTAIRATGDTHLATVEYMAESSTRTTSSGAATGSFASSVDFDDVYSYNAAALEVRRAYAKTPARPTQFVNGHYYQGSSDNKLMDDLTGWALTSGSKGMFYGSEATWQWGSGAYAALSTEGWPNNNLPATIGWFTALRGWQKLVPDTSSAFITSSRGTDATAITSGGSGGEYNAASTQNNYLTGAVTADGTLGLLYTPTSRSITIDTSKLVAGFTAKWVDPASGTKTTVTAGSSYTHPGNNSAGHAGWYLLFEGTPTVALNTATITLAVVASSPAAQQITKALATAALTLAAVAVSPAAGAVTVALNTATVTFTAQATSPAAQPVTVALSVATVTLTAVSTTPAAGTTSVTLNPATLALTAPATSPAAQPVTAALGVAGITLTGVVVGVGGVGSLNPAVLTLTVVPVTPVPQTITIGLATGTITLAAVATSPAAQSGQVTLNPATVSLSAVAVSPQGATIIALAAGAISLAAIPVTPTPGAVTLSLTPATLTLTAVAIITSGAPEHHTLTGAFGASRLTGSIGTDRLTGRFNA